ncbi:MAG: polysaccharide biosynthesis tyrosine autokinase [Brevundimonas sp.]|uniref:GumC family protein n=1 Tax=Brevundimonas sp. TaxID=1871086 RepID=UPI001806A120|nr:polysaccharide biosynthesis tyrosine autokinase [Brevundimonas sp.]MBA4804676.1 polysaccharide biosynthesis tyrosine autokinase [Brevundimonas sp.]
MNSDATLGRRLIDEPVGSLFRMGGDDRPAFDVAEYWRLALKHRFVILGSLIAALVIGLTVTLLMTPIYTASVTLQIEREAVRVLNVDDVQPRETGYQAEEFFQTQYGLLRSRSLAERVIDSLGLASSDAFLDQMGVDAPSRGSSSAADHSAARRRLVLRAVQENLDVSPVRGSRLVVVTFDSPNPQLSARIVNAFAENFIQVNLDRKFESSRYAREFLEERIAQTKAKLEDAERELVAYAAAQQIINVEESTPEGGEAQSLTTNNLVALNSALAQARAARIAAEQKWLQARNAPALSLTEVLQNPAIQQMVQQRAQVDAEYQQKLRVYQPDWPEMQQLSARLAELDEQIGNVAGGIRSSLQGQYQVAANQERSLQAQVDSLSGEVLNQRARSVQYNILKREVDTSRTLYDGLLQRYKEVGVTGGVAANNISIVDRAVPPASPSKPQLIINMALAALIGLALGVAAAFLMEALNESLATPEDVETKLGLPVLGVAPLLGPDEQPVAALADVRSSFSEAYYSLRTALQFSTPDGAPATMLVTSSRPAEGKSTTAYAIALTLARVGKRVLLVDGDLRNPSMHRVVGTDNDTGMSNLLSGSATIEELIKATGIDNLHFIPCGPLPPNPAELWGGDRVGRVLDHATTLYDHVVIDGPPVLGFADAPLLAAQVRGTIFVLEARGTRRAQARGALRRLLVGRGHLLGAVLTKFNVKATQYGGYDYAYDYHYGARDDSGAGTRRGAKKGR